MLFQVKAVYICYTCHVVKDGEADAAIGPGEPWARLCPTAPLGWKFHDAGDKLVSFCSEICAIKYAHEKSAPQA